jgi:cellobiose-specific phosphotransferase system component IIC
MKYSLILSFIPFIFVILYVLLRYYVKTDYKIMGNYSNEAIFITSAVIGLFWYYGLEPFLDKKFR